LTGIASDASAPPPEGAKG